MPLPKVMPPLLALPDVDAVATEPEVVDSSTSSTPVDVNTPASIAQKTLPLPTPNPSDIRIRPNMTPESLSGTSDYSKQGGFANVRDPEASFDVTNPVGPALAGSGPDYISFDKNGPLPTPEASLPEPNDGGASIAKKNGIDLSGIASFLGNAGGNVMKALTSPEARGIVGALGKVAGLYGQSRSAAAGQTETNPIYLQRQREFELAKQAKELENQRTLLGTQTETQKAMQTKSLELEKLLGFAGLDQQTVNKILDIFNAQNAIETEKGFEYGTGPNTKSSYEMNKYSPTGFQALANKQAVDFNKSLTEMRQKYLSGLMSQINGGVGPGSNSALDAFAKSLKATGGANLFNYDPIQLNEMANQDFSKGMTGLNFGLNFLNQPTAPLP